MNKFFKNILIILSSFLLLVGILIFGILWSYSNNIPDYKFLKSYKPPVSSKVYSGNGNLVADFSTEKRIFVPFNSIPKNVIYSFLSEQALWFVQQIHMNALPHLFYFVDYLNIFCALHLEHVLVFQEDGFSSIS